MVFDIASGAGTARSCAGRMAQPRRRTRDKRFHLPCICADDGRAITAVAVWVDSEQDLFPQCGQCDAKLRLPVQLPGRSGSGPVVGWSVRAGLGVEGLEAEDQGRGLLGWRATA